MRDPLVMRHLQRFTNVFRNVQRLLDRDRPTRDALGQRFAFHEFQHQETCAFRFFQIVNRGDVWMIQ